MRRRGVWRRALLAPLAVLVALNLAVWLGYTLPRSVEHQRVSERVAELGRLVEEQRLRTQALTSLAESISSSERDSEHFFGEVVCPTEAAFLDQIEDLERAVLSSGLRPDRRTIRREELHELGLARYLVSLPASGSYRQLVDLIDEIERSAAFVILEAIRLTSTDPGSANMQVELSTYCILGAGGDAA